MSTPDPATGQPAVATSAQLVIRFVGATLLGSVAGIIALAVTGNTVPDVLQNVAVGALTGLLGLLAPAGRNSP